MRFWRRKKKNEPEKDEQAEQAQVEPATEETPEPESTPEPVPELAAEPVPEIIPEPVKDAAEALEEPKPVQIETPEPDHHVVPEDVQAELRETPTDIIEDITPTPVPAHTPVEDAVAAEEETQAEEADEKGGWFSRLKQGLSKSSDKLGQGITDLITKKKLDQDTLDDLEELLITADLGPATASRLVDEFGKGRFGKEISDEEVRLALSDSISHILTPVALPMEIAKPVDGPFVILVAGVNGAGKTTTIAKLAQKLIHQDKCKVMMAAGDTFRAAAIEQLKIWADRTGSQIVAKELGSDAAAVAYEAYTKARENDVDVLMIDTAGRLHNKKNLMAELEKIVRVLKKQNEAVPHAVLLVLDATTGQNAHEQVKIFKDMIDVTGLVVTKLDGSARGGVVVRLADEFGLPIHFIGVGEQADDLQPFNPMHFAKSLMGLA